MGTGIPLSEPCTKALGPVKLAGSAALLLHHGTFCCFNNNAATLLQVAALLTSWLLRVRSVARQACRHQLMQQRLCGVASNLAGQLRQLLGIDLQLAAAVVLVQPLLCRPQTQLCCLTRRGTLAGQ